MKHNNPFIAFSEEITFECSRFNKIDAKKYTLYDVLANSNLDTLSLNDRLLIFNSWHEDLEMNQMVNNHRYSFDGCGTERTVFDPSVRKAVRMINFGSNDYLNMSQHPAVVEAGIEAMKRYGAGAGASCNASGQTKIKVDLENEIADTFGYEKALVYPTGFMTNTGVLSALLRSNDIAVIDMLAHASIMDGAGGRNKMLFKHNDIRSLETVLRRVNRQYANKIVIVDGVYSMDGDIANLPEISALCKKYDALLMVDDAHAFGVIGKNGLGALDHFNLPPESVDILVGTLSKAIGCSGGFVTGRKELINYLKFASRPYFFTTAPFVASNAAALESIRIIRHDRERQNNLWININYFREKLDQSGFNLGHAETAIFPIILGNHNQVIDVTTRMGHNGVLTNGIPYPAVSRKQTRIRMTVTSEMTLDQLNKGYSELCNAINRDRPLNGKEISMNMESMPMLKTA
jgi:glycine C-acetyltransferase